MLEFCIISSLVHGAQTWTLNKTQASKLQATQRSMERSNLGIRRKDRIRNVSMRGKTHMKDVIYVIKRAKLKCARHVARTKEDTWSKWVMDWLPYGHQRRRGRPVFK